MLHTVSRHRGEIINPNITECFVHNNLTFEYYLEIASFDDIQRYFDKHPLVFPPTPYSGLFRPEMLRQGTEFPRFFHDDLNFQLAVVLHVVPKCETEVGIVSRRDELTSDPSFVTNVRS